MSKKRQGQAMEENPSSLEKDKLVEELKRKKSSFQSKLARFWRFLNEAKSRGLNSSLLIELDTRLKGLEDSLFSDYNEVQFQLEGISFEEFKEPDNEWFESDYYQAVAFAKEMIFDASSPQLNVKNAGSKCSQCQSVWTIWSSTSKIAYN